ncbi:MAG: hypothetical protein M1821_005405 [Bathelium mastoideum]|nr:MAG: hypothetical protein M1821_005405 [Bathelium mastoideum]
MKGTWVLGGAALVQLARKEMEGDGGGQRAAEQSQNGIRGRDQPSLRQTARWAAEPAEEAVVCGSTEDAQLASGGWRKLGIGTGWQGSRRLVNADAR